MKAWQRSQSPKFVEARLKLNQGPDNMGGERSGRKLLRYADIASCFALGSSIVSLLAPAALVQGD